MDIWTKGAARCYVSRAFFKRYAYLVMYGWREDPWLCHIFLEEMARLIREERR
jgi:hypothetical protein